MKLFGGTKQENSAKASSLPSGKREKSPEQPSGKRFRAESREEKKTAGIIIFVCLVVCALFIAATLFDFFSRIAPEREPEAEIAKAEALVFSPVEASPSSAVSQNAGQTDDAAPVDTAEASGAAAKEELIEPVLNEERAHRDNCFTFLFLFNDQLMSNTDAIVLARFDFELGELNFVSLPRDTLMDVSWGVKKANTVYAFSESDIDRAAECYAKLLGFTPDFYALFNISTVRRLVDAIGGVYFNVPRDMDYDDESQNLHIHIPAGYRLLTGEDAEKVLRYVNSNEGLGYSDGDLGRIDTQGAFLLTMAKQILKSGSFSKQELIAQIVGDYAKTNITALDIAFLAKEFFFLKEDKISFTHPEGSLVFIRHGSYFQLDSVAWLSIINEKLNPYNFDIVSDEISVLSFIDNESGCISTTGETVPIEDFYDFLSYTG